MIRVQWSVVLLCVIFTALHSETVMKITLAEEVSEEFAAEIGKISFSADSMILAASRNYALDNIAKIEFYEDSEGGTFVGDGRKGGLEAREVSQGLEFRRMGDMVHIAVPHPEHVEVFVCGLNGQSVAEIYSGRIDAGEVRVPLNSSGLSTALYSIVVKTGKTLYVKKYTQLKGRVR